ncbi:hypothetical protein BDV29DRAFT_153919 [Aspergillus leporis]|uniref:Uncharacterized protein n=1 Tax=Aspergillus leporis TaxID=41062 RepID=A0A5N5X8X2_9EURO|nr:hypothetical protein BDV29DRAFT_153919 [Aspergillus leporis]
MTQTQGQTRGPVPAPSQDRNPAITVLCVWGFATNYGLIALVCILFGGFSGGYVVLRNLFATAIVGNGDLPNEELIVSGLTMLIRDVPLLRRASLVWPFPRREIVGFFGREAMVLGSSFLASYG